MGSSMRNKQQKGFKTKGHSLQVASLQVIELFAGGLIST